MPAGMQQNRMITGGEILSNLSLVLQYWITYGEGYKLQASSYKL
jgi:hypothetical protein